MRLVVLLVFSFAASLVIYLGGEYAHQQFTQPQIKIAETSAMPEIEEPLWIRTTQGWELASTWEQPAYHRVAVHPLLFGLIQLLVSIAILVAFADDDLFSSKPAEPASDVFPRLFVQ